MPLRNSSFKEIKPLLPDNQRLNIEINQNPRKSTREKDFNKLITKASKKNGPQFNSKDKQNIFGPANDVGDVHENYAHVHHETHICQELRRSFLPTGNNHNPEAYKMKKFEVSYPPILPSQPRITVSQSKDYGDAAEFIKLSKETDFMKDNFGQFTNPKYSYIGGMDPQQLVGIPHHFNPRTARSMSHNEKVNLWIDRIPLWKPDGMPWHNRCFSVDYSLDWDEVEFDKDVLDESFVISTTDNEELVYLQSKKIDCLTRRMYNMEEWTA
ncbi:Pfs1p KNAG_0D02710 [Huiozyma naganishii CBS 8797]|uniref:Uncharacterized protein n=1 Tax=Huiozyma naganishii (strain ATCC MYA-139 / BCRC 22969 / CBS 8797 / KCTC 17520 / NBRC 10181 / NCYC 3082 / Yp74L-3) TaxID=1071383 RepID=J7R5A9_HUIN7|nr:hypothetical protein KNAG_0D02710 [Kazachstania naganishii CBS 8797]CCK70020.1 hypothetical protein KNAG_0D02710 [Kazachstania naganishii CBS 8797]